MGNNKTKKQRRKKARQQRIRRERQQHNEQKTSASQLPPLQKPTLSLESLCSPELPFMKYVCAYVPCENGDAPDHHLTCPFFELDVYPIPDTLVTRDTRITSTFTNLSLEIATLLTPNIEQNKRVVCLFAGNTPTGTKVWFRCSLPNKHEIVKLWFHRLERRLSERAEPLDENDKILFITAPIKALRLHGTIVGFDDLGANIPPNRHYDKRSAIVLQDVTLDRMPQRMSTNKTLSKSALD